MDATPHRFDLGSASELVISNAWIVGPDEDFLGSLRVLKGVIDRIDRGPARAPAAVDLGGEFLLPGLIDVHSDNLEKHAIPRPGVFWDGLSAALAHDSLIASAGITTVFDSLCVGAVGKPDRRKALPAMIDGLDRAEAGRMLRADHRLHLRCDVTEPDLDRILAPFIDHPRLALITMLEDSARRDVRRFKSILKRRGPEADTGLSAERVLAQRTWLAAECRRRGIVWGNHDDTRAWHIDEGTAMGMTIAEFPVTSEAARAAHAAGMPIIGGAPNVVAGKSHAGGLSMRALVAEGMVRILCSDYIPASLLHAAFLMVRDPVGLPLSNAVALASRVPAEQFGLSDRGAIDIGRRGDLIHVSLSGGTPLVRASWRAGARIY
jgi:alpha-D-ribose 1-methylphosphonate 5-triphosphate diphosphatase